MSKYASPDLVAATDAMSIWDMLPSLILIRYTFHLSRITQVTKVSGYSSFIWAYNVIIMIAI